MIALDKCIIKPSRKKNEITDSHKFTVVDHGQPLETLSDSTKTLSFRYDKSLENDNIVMKVSNRQESFKTNPVYLNNCSCTNDRLHEMYNFEFVADTFYDQDIKGKTTKRLEHPLHLMVIKIPYKFHFI